MTMDGRKIGTINVYGVDYDVILTSDLEQGCYGRSDCISSQIWINERQPDQQKEVTLLHEMIHLMWCAMGLSSERIAGGEQMINAIATELIRMGYTPSKQIKPCVQPTRNKTPKKEQPSKSKGKTTVKKEKKKDES